MPIRLSITASVWPVIPPTKPSAQLGTPSAASARDTLKPFPPASTVLLAARSTLSNTNAGMVSSRSSAGLSVTV